MDGLADRLMNLPSLMQSFIEKYSWHILKVFLLGCVSFWTALSIYCLLYYFWIPVVAHEQPLKLVYNHAGSFKSHDGTIMEEPFIVGWADFSQHSFSQVLSGSLRYDVNLEMSMPSNSHNIDSGNFMVSVHLMSVQEPIDVKGNDVVKSLKRNEWRLLDYIQRNGTEVYSSSKSVLMFYKSWLVQTAETLLQIPFILVGLSSYADSQMIKLPCLSSIWDDYYTPITHAIVKIHPFASKIILNGGASYPQIYNSNIRLDAHFSGLRYYMYYYPLPTGILFVLGLSIYFFICGFALYYYFFIHHELFGDVAESKAEPVSKRPLPAAKEVDIPTPPPEKQTKIEENEVSDHEEEYEPKHEFEVDSTTETESDLEIVESPVTAIQEPSPASTAARESAASEIVSASSSSVSHTDIDTVTDSSLTTARTDQSSLPSASVVSAVSSQINENISAETSSSSSSGSDESISEISSSEVEMKTPLDRNPDS